MSSSLSKLCKLALPFGSCLIAALLLLAATGEAVESGSIGAKPANPRPDNSRTQSIFVHEVSPGDTVKDAVQVINNTDEHKTILLYATDSQLASGGAFACAQMVDEPVSVGKWITLEKSSLTLAPNSTETVPFEISLPETASAGEHNGCIVVQDSQQAPSRQGNGIVLTFRSALRVAITVPGEITKGLRFTDVAVQKLENRRVRLTVGLNNNGNVSLDADLEVGLDSLFGTTVQSSEGEFPVLAHSDAAFNFELEEPFWGGWYAARAIVTYSSDVDKSLGEGGNRETLSSKKVYFFVAPSPVALAIELAAVAMLLSAGVFTVWHRVDYRRMRTNSKSYVVKAGDTLHTVAKKNHTSWKRIARLNKLEAPYHIDPGQKILIPRERNHTTKRQ